MNACPAVYVVVWHWLPTDLYTVSEPCLTTTIAPPGCECQPEDPPGLTVICAMAMSVPNCSGMVPRDVLVPRAKATFVSADGGVAAADPTVTAVTTPARATHHGAQRTARFIPPPAIDRSGG